MAMHAIPPVRRTIAPSPDFSRSACARLLHVRAAGTGDGIRSLSRGSHITPGTMCLATSRLNLCSTTLPMAHGGDQVISSPIALSDWVRLSLSATAPERRNGGAVVKGSKHLLAVGLASSGVWRPETGMS